MQFEEMAIRLNSYSNILSDPKKDSEQSLLEAFSLCILCLHPKYQHKGTCHCSCSKFVEIRKCICSHSEILHTETKGTCKVERCTCTKFTAFIEGKGAEVDSSVRAALIELK